MSKTPKTLFRGKALTLNLEAVAYPDGSSGTLEIVRHPGGAGVVALTPEQDVYLLRQFRHAAGGWIWEIPAGRIEAGEDPLHTAQRELLEEAGCQAQAWTALGDFLPSPGICDERIYLYLARDLTLLRPAHEGDEFIEVHRLPLADALAWAKQGKIQDAKTLIALYRTQQWLDPQYSDDR
jgi:ADP-ribose pyrophosphatase